MGGRSTIVAMLYAVGAIGREDDLVVPSPHKKSPSSVHIFPFTRHR